MASSEGKAKLMAARAAYQSAGSSSEDAGKSTGKMAGFELKPGSHGRSSGPALPINDCVDEAATDSPGAESGENPEA